MTTKQIIPTRVLKTAIASIALTAMVATGPATAAALKSGTTLKPGHGMSFLVGNKRATTYFHPAAGTCEITVMVSEAEPMTDAATYIPASRLRMKLTPGTVSRIDSFEGKTLSVICDAEAKTMTVLN